MYLYKVGTQSGVLIKQGVLISEVSFKRGSTVVATEHGRYDLSCMQKPLSLTKPGFEAKQAHEGMEPSKTNQTRWE